MPTGTPPCAGLQAALWSPIIGFDDKLAPYAALATRVPTLANGDARVIGGSFRVTVHLKPTLRWSDGSPLTASDVLFGLKLNLDPAIGNSFGLDEIAHMAAPDAHTMVLTFGDTYGAYLAYAMPPALPRAYFQRKYRSADIHALALAYRGDPYDSPSDVFSGPYRVAGVAPGQRLTLDPNPSYTAPAGAVSSGARPELRYVALSEDEAALARDLRSGQAGVDVALGLSPATLSELGGLAGGLQARALPSLAVEHLELNMATPALRDIRVRQALQYAIDKRAFVRALFPAAVGAAAPVATSLIPAVSPYHDGSIPVSLYDPARARALLSAARYVTTPNGAGRHLTLTLVTVRDLTRQREADLLTKSLAAVGVRVVERLTSPSPSDQGGFYAPYDRGGVLATRNFDLALFDLRLGPDPATAASLFDPARVPDAISRGILRRNYTGINVDALAMLPEAAQASLDMPSRRLGYAKLQRKVNQLLPYIVLYDRPQVVVADGHVRNFAPAPQDQGALWNSWQYARS